MVDPLWKAIGEVLDRFIPAVEGDEIATAIAVALRTRGFIAANVYQCRTCGWVDGEHDPNDDRCNPFADTPAAARSEHSPAEASSVDSQHGAEATLPAARSEHSPAEASSVDSQHGAEATLPAARGPESS